jgi:hypothetical protein
MALDQRARLDLTTAQVKALVRQLPKKARMSIAQEIARDVLAKEFTELVDSFKTDDLDEETIRKEVEAVRSRRYAARKKKAAKGRS